MTSLFSVSEMPSIHKQFLPRNCHNHVNQGVSEEANQYDTFLCYSRSDLALVTEIGSYLRNQNIKVWLDIWELVPGRSWQEYIENLIDSVSTAVVFVSEQGFGAWQSREIRGLLREFVRRDLPVIPVLLPGIYHPTLPIFMSDLTWVDLRQGITYDGLNQILWGITGDKYAALRYESDKSKR